MHCPVCGHENAADAKFCSNCGNPMTVTCPTCGTTAPVGANFCNNCGSRLGEDGGPEESPDDALGRLIPPEMLAKLRSARSGRAMAGERRTVTMLFADVKGSTAAAERMDPEDWADLMNSAFAALIEPIYRYEGTLARLLGDAVLAFFGAPIAHEDDPVRAVRAGLDIVEGMAAAKADILRRHGVEIDVRVGINTGLVVVGEVGSDLRVEYTALGDAINLAARMEQTAEPGTVQVSEPTFALTHGAFDAEDLGLVEVKGKSEPIRTFRPIAYRGDRIARDVAHGFVGRDRELDDLDGLVDRVRAGSGWIASIIAEAGLGKSALLREWERRTEASTTLARHPHDPGDIALMTGASQSYDAAKPMSGFRNVLRRWFDLDGGDEYEVIATALGDDADPDTVALLGHVAGVDLPTPAAAFIGGLQPPVLLALSRRAVAGYVTAESARRPVIVAFEDLHWSDDLTIDYIGDLLAVTEANPVGIALAMRPYRDDPSWRVHERAARDHSHRYRPIELEPLDEQAAEELLHDLLDGLDLDESELASVLERSAGNPLFLEEIAGSLSAGGSVVGVPDSLSGVLAARLDRLDERARLVAQVSSILGTQFRRETVAALADGEGLDGTITDLLRQGVLVESTAIPGRLQFRHALLRDAAYSSVLLKTRRRLHGDVARHLEEAEPDAAPDIARHYVAADDLASAFPHLVEAGVRATRAMALADAIRDLKLAIEHAPEDADPDLVEHAHLTLGEAYALLPDLSESAAAFQRLFDYGEKAERPTAQVAALNQLGFTTAAVGGDLDAANEYLKQARILAERVGDERGLVEYHMNACMVAAFAGDPAAAAAHDAQTTALGEAIGDERVRVEGLRRRTMNQALILELDQAEASLELASAAAEALGSEQAVAELEVLGRSFVAMLRGRYRDSIACTKAQLPVLERYVSFDLPISHGQTGEAYFMLGDLESALSAFAAQRRTAVAGGQPFSDSLGAAAMAATYAALGMPGEAMARASETDIGVGPMGDYFASSAWAHLGMAHLLLDEPSEAADAFSHGLAAPSVVQYMDRARLLVGLILSLTASGDLDRAATVLVEAEEWVEEKGLVVERALVAMARGRLQSATGDAEAIPTLETAIADLDGLELRWAALLGASMVAATTGKAEHLADLTRRAEDIAGDIADEDLRASFLARWSDPARTGA